MEEGGQSTGKKGKRLNVSMRSNEFPSFNEPDCFLLGPPPGELDPISSILDPLAPSP